MKLVKKLAGVRKLKTSDALITTTPTEGTVRINAIAVEMIGANYNQVLSGAGQRCEIAAIGVGENGKHIYGISLCTVEGEGSKLAQPSLKKAGTLQFNNANIWSEIGGTTETNTNYLIEAEKNVVTHDEDGNFVSYEAAIESGYLDEDGCFVNDNEEEGEVAGEKAVVWFIMEFISTEPKPERKVRAKGDAGDASDDEESEEEVPTKGKGKGKNKKADDVKADDVEA